MLLNLGCRETAVGGSLLIFTCVVGVWDDIVINLCFYIKKITVSYYFYHSDFVLPHYAFIRRKLRVLFLYEYYQRGDGNPKL